MVGRTHDDEGKPLTLTSCTRTRSAGSAKAPSPTAPGSTSDAATAGIVMIRRQLLADIERVAQGQDPKGVVRRDDDEPIPLPLRRHASAFTQTRSRADFDEWHALLERMGFPSDYPFQAGQPARIRELLPAGDVRTGGVRHR